MNFVSNAIIQNISFDQNAGLVTISYNDCPNCRTSNHQIILIVTSNTAIQNEVGNPISFMELTIGMIINAAFSFAMTRSIPPQAQAFDIQVISQIPVHETTTGRIIEINSQNQTITTMKDFTPSSMIRFNLSPDTVILNQWGRSIPLSRLVPGFRVRIQHASFMTASIPPQTTAFVIQVL